MIAEGTDATLTHQQEGIIIGDETLRYVAKATYGDAPVKKDNLGNESTDNWFAGGEIESTVRVVVGERYRFYGAGTGDLPEKMDSDFIRGMRSRSSADGEFTTEIRVEVGEQYI